MLAQDDPGATFLGEDLVAYLVLAFGGALFVGNLLAVLRPPPPGDGGGTVRAPMGRSLAMATLGLVAAIWALASLVQG